MPQSFSLKRRGSPAANTPPGRATAPAVSRLAPANTRISPPIFVFSYFTSLLFFAALPGFSPVFRRDCRLAPRERSANRKSTPYGRSVVILRGRSPANQLTKSRIGTLAELVLCIGRCKSAERPRHLPLHLGADSIVLIINGLYFFHIIFLFSGAVVAPAGFLTHFPARAASQALMAAARAAS